jgi:hypothetical protein
MSTSARDTCIETLTAFANACFASRGAIENAKLVAPLAAVMQALLDVPVDTPPGAGASTLTKMTEASSGIVRKALQDIGQSIPPRPGTQGSSRNVGGIAGHADPELANLTAGSSLQSSQVRQSLLDTLRIVISQGVLSQEREIIRFSEISAEAFKAGLATFDASTVSEIIAGKRGADETPALTLNELQAIRAELKALRIHAGAGPATIKDGERFAHMPPPVSAKRGHWMAVVGSALPVWIEEVAPSYDELIGRQSTAGAAGTAAEDR